MCVRWFLLLSSVVAGLAGCSPAGQPQDVKVGALFPLSNSQAPLASEEYAGVQIAASLANADGGVGGKRIELVARDLTVREDAESRVQALKALGANVVVGTYSSSLSVPASQAADGLGIVYWEAGAVADQVTGRGLTLVFRVGATGRNLGSMSSRFTAEVIAPSLHRRASQLRMAIVQEGDEYGTSVGGGAAMGAAQLGIPVVAAVTYDAYAPDWSRVINAVRTSGADILVLASYIPDGVAFRKAMLAGNLHVDALIGSTMAECGPEFGASLGPDAVGVFASDRPPASFNPAALNPTGLADYTRFARSWRSRYHHDPSEEGLSGFAAAWSLMRYVLPAAARAGDLSPHGIARAARELDLPSGSLANGGGVRFSESADSLGQNLEAPSVVWQWQAVRKSVTVYPPVFATGQPILIPLPR
jgi:branched-chain amino acid transport system substrate-binding protein